MGFRMAMHTAQSEIESFHEFLGRRIQDGGKDLTPEASVQEFRVYQDELQRFIEATQPAIQQSERRESKPLDLDALMQRVKARLAEKGITD